MLLIVINFIFKKFDCLKKNKKYKDKLSKLKKN